MAKKEYDSFVTALIGIKDMMSNLKMLADVVAFEPDCGIVYMYLQDSIQECYAVITDDDILKSADKFTYHLLNTVETVGFNKALKKTKTVSEIKDDGSIYFSTDGYETILSLPKLDDYHQFTSKYHRLFKDIDLTRECFAITTDDINWVKISESNMDALKANHLICINTSNGTPMWISKGLFGNIKKTNEIYHMVIQESDYDEIVLFRQVENGYDIYHVLRFLKIDI